MSYQVLARKYRPQRFSEVIGQEHVTRTLQNAISQQRIAHGYIFSGHRGIGKTTIARILAMALNCRGIDGKADKPTPEPCGVCDSCVEVRAGSSVDVIEIDAATGPSCTIDANCPGTMCLPSGLCAAADSVLYAAPNGSGTPLRTSLRSRRKLPPTPGP